MFRMTGKCFYLFLAGWLFATVSFAQSDGLVKFIENKNQWPSGVQFSAQIPGGTMSVSPGKFSYAFLDYKKLQELHERSHFESPDAMQFEDESVRGHSVEVNFIGANTYIAPKTSGRSTEYYNYFIGSDPSRWASKAYAYEMITYASIYPNIDMEIYASGSNVKYDFIVSPCADVSKIKLQYKGANEMVIAEGDLRIGTALAAIVEKKPVAYQLVNGKRTAIRCEYVLAGEFVTFCFPQGYDNNYELVIDPLLIFSTYSGSRADNWGSSVTPGEHGNLYSTGVTTVSDSRYRFPATVGAFQTTYGGLYDIGILKYDSTGSKLLYATYLGGQQF